ncbi:MAG: hypothetical protein K2M19_08480 [Muribaculaceae bacterium]|nr:hypothetical protein [Muribaculaceae bacterium]
MVERTERLSVAGVGIVVFLAFLGFMFTMPGGDDWVYAGVIGGVDPQVDSWLRLPGAWFGHWMGSNGRVPNFLMTPLMMAPVWLRALLCAGFLGAFYWLVLVSARSVRRPLIAAFLCACLCFALPWWDSFNLFACQTNYVWASVGILVTIYIIVKDPEWPLWLSMLAAAAGATGHESATIGAGAGVLLWLILNPEAFTRRRRLLLLAAVIGGLLPVASPGIWHRAGADGHADDPFFLLLIKSDLPAVLLWTGIPVAIIVREWRGCVLRLLRSSAVIYAVGAAVCTAISLYSGIVGRSGWFGSVFSIIFLGLWLAGSKLKLSHSRVYAAVIWIIILAQCVYTAFWQIRLYGECEEFRTQYVAGPDGVVYLDYTRLNEIPAFTLGKVRGVPDPDDLYLLSTFARYHRSDKVRPVVLPEECRDSLVPGALKNGDLIVSVIPEPRLFTVGFDSDTLYATEFADCSEKRSIFVAQPADTLWHLSPLIIAPGDRPSFRQLE